MHANLIAALAEDRRKSCPCSAVTEQPYDLFRQRPARLVWRRHTSRSPRSAVRLPDDRQTPARVWAAATSLLRITSKGGRS